MRLLLLLAALGACTTPARPSGPPAPRLPGWCFTGAVRMGGRQVSAAGCLESRSACEAALDKVSRYAELVGVVFVSNCGRGEGK